jgi:hypothetical protein
MNDDELGHAVGASVERRVARTTARPDVEALVTRVERRSQRQRRLFQAGLVVVLVAGIGVGYAAGSSGSRTPHSQVVAISDGAPGAPPEEGPAIAPADVDAATVAVVQAFHDAYDGTSPAPVRTAAIQGGAQLEALRTATLASAATQGFSAEQFAGASIQVRDTSFVDRTHAVVHFTLTIPGHGAVLVDVVGYAVADGGRWQVSLRTACDLLSLSGLGRACPPASLATGSR